MDKKKSEYSALRAYGLDPDNVTIVPVNNVVFGGQTMAENEKADKQIKAYATESQVSQFEEAMKQHGHHGKTEALRHAMALYCESVDVEFNPEVRKRGGWQGSENSLKALEESRKKDK